MNLIEQVIAPLRNDAILAAREEAAKVVQRYTAELNVAGWDMDKVAPYPRVTDRNYMRARQKYYQVEAIVECINPTSRPGHPIPCKLCQVRVDRFIKEAEENAETQYDLFVLKLVDKIGPVISATLQGNHVWSYSILTVTKENGEVEAWKTQMIINVSKLGKLFNQWPSRKLKRV